MTNEADRAEAFDWKTATTLTCFLARAPVLSTEERLRIIDQATSLLRDYYVHLPEKIRLHGIDPLADLAVLRESADAIATERDFHDRLCGIFAELRDLHTQYSLPTYFQGSVALLPFKIDMCLDRGTPIHLVTARLASYPWQLQDQHFAPGAEILTWCGEPIGDVVARAALRSGGASVEARQARARAALCVSPMERQPPPAQTCINLTYRTPEGERSLSCAYAVISVAIEATQAALQHFINLDHEGEVRRHASKHAFRAPAEAAERKARLGERTQAYPEAGVLPTLFPTVLEARPIHGDRFGYLRIHSFRPSVDANSIEELITLFVAECSRLIAALPKQGLVLDVRGNGGGYLPLAESLLQVFTPHPVVPQSLQMLATPSALKLALASDELAAYQPSLQQALDAGWRYSAAFPLTRPDWCNGHGQGYHGPVVLLVDARSYSATDAFAAGFQDHAIGPVLGVAATGGGGANVWTLPDFTTAGDPPTMLPGGASLRVALRRTRRVAPSEGTLVEEVGVVPEYHHTTTRADLLDDDHDLLARAAALLERRDWYTLDVAMKDGSLVLTVQGIDAVRVTCGELMWSQDLTGVAQNTAFSLAAPPMPESVLVVHGFAAGRLVAARRLELGETLPQA